VPNGPSGTWKLTFEDEFSGSSLDTARWSTGWLASGITQPVNPEELECYDPAQVTVVNGELDLKAIGKSESCGGATRPYASGMVNSNGKYNFTYGYTEARLWTDGTTQISDWPAFWSDGQNWPADGEIDTLEGLSGQACWHFHDTGGASGGCAAGNYAGGWHTFGADWEPNSITFYYDGVQVGRITAGVTSSPMYLILNLAVDSTYGGPIQIPGTLRVDYVRVWQH
jgi:beta-glucanase (GH16 family)